ncbi:MAG: CoA-binding protein [Opitutaceae bacterium]|nr:CoA-binding protein [Opitutaceae bacterium]
MATLADAAQEFLSQRRIAVVGVSRHPSRPANLNLRKLRATGHDVFAVNPATALAEGGVCYPHLRAIPGGVDAVLIATPPAATPSIVRECAFLGIRHVWIHRSFGGGSWAPEAESIAREHGMVLIPGGCPAMFCAPIDPAHRCFRWILGLLGKLPQTVGTNLAND